MPQQIGKLLIEFPSDLGDQFIKWEFEGEPDDMANIVSEVMQIDDGIRNLMAGSIALYLVKNKLSFDELMDKLLNA